VTKASPYEIRKTVDIKWAKRDITLIFHTNSENQKLLKPEMHSQNFNSGKLVKNLI
jgi:hypothetical protein